MAVPGACGLPVVTPVLSEAAARVRANGYSIYRQRLLGNGGAIHSCRTVKKITRHMLRQTTHVYSGAGMYMQPSNISDKELPPVITAFYLI